MKEEGRGNGEGGQQGGETGRGQQGDRDEVEVNREGWTGRRVTGRGHWGREGKEVGQAHGMPGWVK